MSADDLKLPIFSFKNELLESINGITESKRTRFSLNEILLNPGNLYTEKILTLTSIKQEKLFIKLSHQSLMFDEK